MFFSLTFSHQEAFAKLGDILGRFKIKTDIEIQGLLQYIHDCKQNQVIIDQLVKNVDDKRQHEDNRKIEEPE